MLEPIVASHGIRNCPSGLDVDGVVELGVAVIKQALIDAGDWRLANRQNAWAFFDVGGSFWLWAAALQLSDQTVSRILAQVAERRVSGRQRVQSHYDRHRRFREARRAA